MITPPTETQLRRAEAYIAGATIGAIAAQQGCGRQNVTDSLTAIVRKGSRRLAHPRVRLPYGLRLIDDGPEYGRERYRAGMTGPLTPGLVRWCLRRLRRQQHLPSPLVPRCPTCGAPTRELERRP